MTTTQQPATVGGSPSNAALREAAPEAYVMWLQTRHCRGCGRIHETFDLFVRTALRGTWGLGKASNLRPFHGTPQYNLPIEVRQREALNTFTCHICVRETSLAHLPLPPAQDTRLLNGVQEAPEAPATRDTSKTPAKAKPTIADLNF